MASYDLITAIKCRGGNAYVRKNDSFVDAIGIRSNYDAAMSRHSVALDVATNLTAAASTALVSAAAYKQSAANAASNLESVNYALLTSSSNLASLSTAYASTLANTTIATQQATIARAQTSKANQIMTAAQASNAVAVATLSDAQSTSSKIDADLNAAHNAVTNATVAVNVTKTKAATDRKNATNAINLYHTTIRQNMRFGYDYRIYDRAVEANNAANASAQTAASANAALVAANGKLQAALTESAIAAKALAAAQAAAKSTAASLAAAQTLRTITNIDVNNKIASENEAAARTNMIKTALDSTSTINNNAIAMVPLAMASVSNANNAYLQRQQNALVVNNIANVARVASGNADVISLGSLL